MKLRSILVGVSCFILSACGGGGGGGDDSVGGGDRYGVRVLHGAIEVSPVEYSDPGEAEQLLSTEFLGTTLYKTFPEGGQTLSLFRKNSGGTRFLTSASFTVDPEARYSALLYGDQTEIGPRMFVLEDSVPELSDDQVAIRFIHAADLTSSISAQINSENTGAISFGRSSDYVVTTAGELSFSVRSTSNSNIASGIMSTEAKKAYSILVAGEVGVFVGTKVYEDR